MAPSPRRLAASGLIVLGLTGCGSASLPRDVLRYDVGRGSRGDIELVIPEMLVRHGYTIQLRRNTEALLYFETAWLNREPFEDEVRQCEVECRTRIIVEARRQGGEIFSVTLRAENAFRAGPGMVTRSPEAEWNALPPTPKFRDHVAKISSDIGDRIDAGVRVFRPS
jgi:hypothetical protein